MKRLTVDEVQAWSTRHLIEQIDHSETEAKLGAFVFRDS